MGPWTRVGQGTLIVWAEGQGVSGREGTGLSPAGMQGWGGYLQPLSFSLSGPRTQCQDRDWDDGKAIVSPSDVVSGKSQPAQSFTVFLYDIGVLMATWREQATLSSSLAEGFPISTPLGYTAPQACWDLWEGQSCVSSCPRSPGHTMMHPSPLQVPAWRFFHALP